MDDLNIKITVDYGYVDLQSSFRIRDDGVVEGVGRNFVYDGDGRLVEQTDWKPTGITIKNARQLVQV